MTTLAVATAAGLLVRRLGLPGGILVGALLGTTAVTFLWGAAVTLPFPFVVAAFASVGLLTGAMVTRDRLRQLGPLAVPAVASACILIVAGAAIAALLGVLGVEPPAAVLATSPGALSVLAAAAVEHGEGAVEVVTFHVVRLVLVIVLIPVLLIARPRRDR